MALASILALALFLLILLLFYLRQPKCPRCHSLQHGRNQLDDSIRFCRHCGHIYRVR